MTDENEARTISAITCPNCGISCAGSFNTPIEQDETGPRKILYKCNGCGRFYTVEKVFYWRVINT
jgi:hypothetical protein